MDADPPEESTVNEIRVSWDSTLTQKLIDIISGNESRKKTLFPPTGAARASVWKTTQAVCIELFRQADDQDRFEFQRKLGRVELKDGVWQGGPAWTARYKNPVKSRLIYLRAAYDKIRASGDMDESWTSWEDVDERYKRDALQKSAPWYFSFQQLLSPTPPQTSAAQATAGPSVASTSASTSVKRKLPPPAAASDAGDSDIEVKPSVKKAARASASGSVVAVPVATSVDRKPKLAPAAAKPLLHSSSISATPIKARSPSPASSDIVEVTEHEYKLSIGDDLRSLSLDPSGSSSAEVWARPERGPAQLPLPSDSGDSESSSGSDDEDNDMEVDDDGGEAGSSTDSESGDDQDSDSGDDDSDGEEETAPLHSVPSAEQREVQREALKHLSRCRNLEIGKTGQRIRVQGILCKSDEELSEWAKAIQFLLAYDQRVENGFRSQVLVDHAFMIKTKIKPITTSDLSATHPGRMIMLRRIIEAFSGTIITDGHWPAELQLHRWQLTKGENTANRAVGSVKLMTLASLIGAMDRIFLAKFGNFPGPILARVSESGLTE